MNTQRGVTLVEVLVSVLILGIGVMGFVAMQMRALGSTSDAYERAQATAIASDFVERMTGQLNNPDRDLVTNKLKTRDQMLAFYTNPTYWKPWGSNEQRDTTCLNGPCNTTAQMALFDINEARYNAATLLANGQVRLGNCPDKVANAVAARDLACFFISWGETQPTVGTGTTDCINEQSDYVSGSRCVVMRVY